MSSTLTEEPIFSAAVVVPDPGEDVDAASVEVPFQSLANRTAYLLAMQPGNWTHVSTVEIANPVVAWVEGYGETGAWVIVGEDNGANIDAEYSIGGVKWQDITNGNLSAPEWMAAAPAADIPLLDSAFITGAADAPDLFYNLDGVWNDVELPTGTGTTCGAWSTLDTRFIVGGVDADEPRPIFWHVTAEDPPTVAAVVPSKVNSTKVQCVAVNQTDGRAVAFGDGTNADSWYSDDGGATWNLLATTIDNPLAIAYSETLGLWMVIANGASGGETYTSTNGTSWTLKSTLADGLEFQDNPPSLAEYGAVWVTVSEVGQMSLLYSVDRGATWRTQRLETTETELQVQMVTYSTTKRRFAIVMRVEDGDDKTALLLSLAAGPHPEVT